MKIIKFFPALAVFCLIFLTASTACASDTACASEMSANERIALEVMNVKFLGVIPLGTILAATLFLTFILVVSLVILLWFGLTFDCFTDFLSENSVIKFINKISDKIDRLFFIVCPLTCFFLFMSVNQLVILLIYVVINN